MNSKSFISSTAVILVLSMTSATCFANSEEPNNSGFFNSGSVTDMSIPLEHIDAEEIQYGTTRGIPVQKPKEISQKLPAPEQNPEQAKEEQAIPQGVDPQAYRLKQEFGDPTEKVDIKGVDSAPKPYKAMLKAIDMGRDDLALEYANQWMGYMKSIDRIARKATSMASVVKLDPETAEDKMSDQAFANIDPAALNKFLDKRKTENNTHILNDEIEINSDRRQEINAFFGEDDSELSRSATSPELQQDPYQKLVDTKIDPTTRKMLIRAELASKIPVDPSGNVQVLFFLKPSDPTSLEVAKQLTQTLSSPTLGVSLGVVPLSVEGVSMRDNNNFYKGSGMPASLRDGLSLSQSLNITQFPALLFVTSNSEKAFLKIGKADAVFIEEVARMIGGR